jgi:hypothetical protein
VGATQTVEFGVTDKDLPGAGAGQGGYTYAPGEIGNANPRVLINANNLADDNFYLEHTIAGQSKFGPGTIQDYTLPIDAWHEFGHAWQMWKNANAAQSGVIPGASGISPQSNSATEALRWEKRMREQVYGPIGPNNAERRIH